MRRCEEASRRHQRLADERGTRHVSCDFGTTAAKDAVTLEAAASATVHVGAVPAVAQLSAQPANCDPVSGTARTVTLEPAGKAVEQNRHEVQIPATVPDDEEAIPCSAR